MDGLQWKLLFTWMIKTSGYPLHFRNSSVRARSWWPCRPFSGKVHSTAGSLPSKSSKNDTPAKLPMSEVWWQRSDGFSKAQTCCGAFGLLLNWLEHPSTPQKTIYFGLTLLCSTVWDQPLGNHHWRFIRKRELHGGFPLAKFDWWTVLSH